MTGLDVSENAAYRELQCLDPILCDGATRYDGDSELMSYALIEYLGENFPGLFLHAPLFYRWPVGLRFDLGGRATTPKETDLVVERATALYEASFRARALPLS